MCCPIQVLRFVQEWCSLTAMKKKLLRRSGLLFHSPTLGLQQLDSAKHPHSSTKRSDTHKINKYINELYHICVSEATWNMSWKKEYDLDKTWMENVGNVIKKITKRSARPYVLFRLAWPKLNVSLLMSVCLYTDYNTMFTNQMDPRADLL